MILPVLCLYCIIGISAQDTVIRSTGNYSNTDFIFAVGVPSLTFENSNDCSAVSNEALCRTDWFLEGTSVGIATQSGTSCTNSDSAIACSLVDSTLTSTFTTYETSSPLERTVSVRLRTDPSLTGQVVYAIKNCDENSTGTDGTVDVSSVGLKNYSERITVPCRSGLSSRADVILTCLSNAAWRQSESCTGFPAGYIAGITITVIGGAILITYIIAAFILGVSWSLTLLYPVIPALFWILGFGLLFGLENGDYDMNGGQIAGCVIGSVAAVVLCGTSVYSLQSVNNYAASEEMDGGSATPNRTSSAAYDLSQEGNGDAQQGEDYNDPWQEKAYSSSKIHGNITLSEEESKKKGQESHDVYSHVNKSKKQEI